MFFPSLQPPLPSERHAAKLGTSKVLLYNYIAMLLYYYDTKLLYSHITIILYPVLLQRYDNTAIVIYPRTSSCSIEECVAGWPMG